MNELKKRINKLVKNWDKIPDEFKKNLYPHGYDEYNAKYGIKGASMEGEIVVLILNREKPNGSGYNFDEERIGFNRFGQIIWGFDSGCSCPTPWDDSHPDCYNASKSWKEFIINIDSFDVGWLKEINKKLSEIESNLE